MKMSKKINHYEKLNDLSSTIKEEDNPVIVEIQIKNINHE